MSRSPTLCGAVLRQAAFAALLAIAPGAAAELAVPPLVARVTDLTGTLSSGQQATLEERLAQFEARKGSQIAVLIVATTQPETVEQYAVRVEEAWKLGRKGISDGVLLLVAKNDRRLRVEVGYGLEGALNDATAKRIIEEEITPRFKQGDYYAGISAGVDRVIRVIDGEPLPPVAREVGGSLLEHSDWLVPGFIILMIASGILRALFGRLLGSSFLGTLAGFVAWAVIGSMFVAIVAGVIVFAFSLLGVSLPVGRRGGWSADGGSDFGGGFSGGGGSSGGGGASGSW